MKNFTSKKCQSYGVWLQVGQQDAHDGEQIPQISETEIKALSHQLQML